MFSFLRSRPNPAPYRLSLQLSFTWRYRHDFFITTLLQMEHETQSGDTGPHYAVPRTLAGSSGVRLIERRPNSEPDSPCPHRLFVVSSLAICPCGLERGLARTYSMITCWDGPRYPAFNSYGSRLRSFAMTSWPHPKRSPGSFAAAGLLYTGKDLCVSLLKQISTP